MIIFNKQEPEQKYIKHCKLSFQWFKFQEREPLYESGSAILKSKFEEDDINNKYKDNRDGWTKL